MVLYDEDDFEDYENALDSFVAPTPPSSLKTHLDIKDSKDFVLSLSQQQQQQQESIPVVKKEIILGADEEKMFDEYEKAYEELQTKFVESKQELFDSVKQQFGENFDDDDDE